jgi:hypothetical protein
MKTYNRFILEMSPSVLMIHLKVATQSPVAANSVEITHIFFSFFDAAPTSTHTNTLVIRLWYK